MRRKYYRRKNDISPVVQRKEDKVPFFQKKEEEPIVQTKNEEEVQMKTAEEEVQKKGEEDEVQRSTEEEVQPKEDEEVRAKSDRGSPYETSDRLSNQIKASNGSGHPMSSKTKAEMEGAFGQDFSQVSIHTDTRSVQMNQELHAQAFTYGTDIYFNKGKYQPDTSSGKHLLAHELTHVVQQGGLEASLQRKEADKHDLTAIGLSGNEKLEACFDGAKVIKKPDKGEHVRKIQEALLQLGIDLPKFKADSEFGSETAEGVRKFQILAGMPINEQDGRVGKKTIGLLDRSLRNGSIETDIDSPEEDFKTNDQNQEKKDDACKGKPSDTPCDSKFLKTVDKGSDAAIAMIEKVEKEQLPPVKTKKADYPSIFSTIFRNNDSRPLSETVKDVKNHYKTIKGFIGTLKTDRSQVRCGTDCDGGCRSGSPAYHSFLSALNKHIITFCPDFEKHPERILIVLHESHHASIQGSSDKAYAHTRLFDKLDHKTALLNAASFHTYAAWVDKPGSESIGPDVKDSNFIKDSGQKDRVDLSLGHLHQWFELVPFDVSETVVGVKEAQQTGVYKSNNPPIFMEQVFSKWFSLTAPSKGAPNKLDVQKIRAIEERIKTMENAFKNVFIVLESPDSSFWERGPGSGIVVNDALLQLDLNHMITALLQELVHATPGISAPLEPLYVGAINDIRKLRKLAP